jgi:DNA-binding MarR family transcriptional regulator
MIDRLEVSGLVERRVDPQDKRVNRIHMTSRGKAILDRMVSVGRRLNTAVMDGLSPAEMAMADKVLTVMRNNLRRALDGEA